MIWMFIDYISERLEKRKYRQKRKAYREKKPDRMDHLLSELGEKYRFLKNLEDGDEIVRYMRLISDEIGKDALDRFILSYRQWCRNHGHQYEELTLNRDIYEHLRGYYGGRLRSSAAELPNTGGEGRLLTDVYCGGDDSDAPGASARDYGASEHDHKASTYGGKVSAYGGKGLEHDDNELDGFGWDPNAEGDDLWLEEMLLL